MLLASMTTLSTVLDFFLFCFTRNQLRLFCILSLKIQCKLQDTKGVVKDAEDTFLDEQQ